HPNLTALTYEEQKSEILQLEDAIFGIIGKRPQIMRPPYGAYNADTLKALVDLNYAAATIWNVDTQ
ncbi:hypothetical protein BJ742DRAFT_665264, partial [Cladochytrium replicatum]